MENLKCKIKKIKEQRKLLRKQRLIQGRQWHLEAQMQRKVQWIQGRKGHLQKVTHEKGGKSRK
jgi:hypothetical protein